MKTGLSRNIVRSNAKILMKEGMVKTQRIGKATFYDIDDVTKARERMLELLLRRTPMSLSVKETDRGIEFMERIEGKKVENFFDWEYLRRYEREIEDLKRSEGYIPIEELLKLKPKDQGWFEFLEKSKPDRNVSLMDVYKMAKMYSQLRLKMNQLRKGKRGVIFSSSHERKVDPRTRRG